MGVQVRILSDLQACDGVVRLLGKYESAEQVMLVMEQCSGGDLQKLSDVRRSGRGAERADQGACHGTGDARLPTCWSTRQRTSRVAVLLV